MAVHRLTIPTGGGRLAAALHLPEAGQRPWPCVVTAHGLLSSKDSDKYVQIGEVFTQAGIAVCRFDFRGCGESQGNLAETTVAQASQHAPCSSSSFLIQSPKRASTMKPPSGSSSTANGSTFRTGSSNTGCYPFITLKASMSSVSL